MMENRPGERDWPVDPLVEASEETPVAEAERSEVARRRFDAVVCAAADVAIIASDPAGLITLFTEGAERMLGYAAEEVVGKASVLILHDPAEVSARAAEIGVEPGFAALVHAAQAGVPETREWMLRRKDGFGLPVSLTVTAKHDPRGRVTGFLGIARSLSDVKQAIEEAGRTASLLRATLESTAEGILSVDLAGRVVAHNRRFLEMFGIEERVLEGGFRRVLQEGLKRLKDPAPGVALVEGVSRMPRGSAEDVLEFGDGRFVLVSSHPQFRGEDPVGRVWSFRDVTAERRAQQEALAAREEALATSRAKSEFLSRMSHELRTPLSAVMGFASLLESDETLTPEQRADVADILRAAQHLLDLINEVLEISRIEQGRLPLSMESVSLGDILRDVLPLVAGQARERQVSIEADPDAIARVFVVADRQRLRQILLNLLSNAVKYNRERGSVAVETAEAGPGRVRLAVCDTGIGIPSERLEEIFEPFVRLGLEDPLVEGTGLGLTLSRRLAEAMGGSMGAESARGKGSTFWLELEGAAEPDGLRAAGEPAWAEGVPLQGLVLLVEDNEANVRLMRRVLAEQPGLELLVADRAASGIETALSEHPDVVLLDLHLPDGHGTRVLEAIRADPVAGRAAVVILSADAFPASIEELRRAGADAYLTKPIRPDRLLRTLAEILRPGGPR